MWQEEVKKKLASIGKSLYLPQRKKKEPKRGKGVVLMAVLADREMRGITGQCRTNL
jgi:hypothetical protein